MADTTEDWERDQKRELARNIAAAMQEHGLTPLHLATDTESQARFQSILQGDVELIPYMTLLRACGAVQRVISPLTVIEDDTGSED